MISQEQNDLITRKGANTPGGKLMRRYWQPAALGAPGDSATRIENRIGEPLADPYLYRASQIWPGLDGIDQRRNPGPSADTPYATDAPLLPRPMAEALHALSEDQPLHRRMGQRFVDYHRHIKAAELARFNAEVTDWEQREYFDLY